VHYDGDEGHGEIDCLVGGGTPIVIEVKSQLVTDSGRRGHRPRLERVARDILERSTDQMSRARDYINAGGRCFAPREGAESAQLLHDDVITPTQIVVSFEGIDPLAISMSSWVGSDMARAAWVTDLADLLVVRDFLGDPGPFLHYAKARSDPTRPVPYMESDGIVGYLEDRSIAASESAVPSLGSEAAAVFRYNSGSINDYYVKAEVGLPAERLGLGIPDEIREALRVLAIQDNSVLWWRVASAILGMTPQDWTRWRRFNRRHGSGRLFKLPAEDVGMMVSSDVAIPEVRSTDAPFLVLPTIG
jgi:hypothetical protein